MTEDEAKTKWCCGPMGEEKCVASACMAWRFHPKQYEIFETLNGVRVEKGLIYTHYERQRMQTEQRLLPRTGYCGLAGIPIRG